MQEADFQRIVHFIREHHLLTLSTVHNNRPYSCSAFYSFNAQEVCFIVASDMTTQHIRNVRHNSSVAVNIALETDEVGKIQGVQCHGSMAQLDQETLKRDYFKAFPYARVMRPVLWKITIEWMKLTDNRLGFGTKIIWKRALSE